MEVLWSWIGTCASTCGLRDLWQHRDLGRRVGGFPVTVGPHDAVALRVANCTDQADQALVV